MTSVVGITKLRYEFDPERSVITRLKSWWRRILRKPQTIEASAILSSGSALSARGRVIPASPSQGATAEHRLSILEGWIHKNLMDELDSLWQRTDRLENAAKAEDKSLQELVNERHKEAQQEIRNLATGDLALQARGVAAIFIGILLTIIGIIVA